MPEILKSLADAAIAQPTRVCGVDPGMSGAACVLGGGGLTVWRNFKTLEDLCRSISDAAGRSDHTVIEFVHAMPGQGVCSMFSFGRSTGAAIAACLVTPGERTHSEVTPQKWQGWYRDLLEIPKGVPVESRVIAARLFPAHAAFFKRKLDHNTGDAVLMALWYLAAEK